MYKRSKENPDYLSSKVSNEFFKILPKEKKTNNKIIDEWMKTIKKWMSEDHIEMNDRCLSLVNEKSAYKYFHSEDKLRDE